MASTLEKLAADEGGLRNLSKVVSAQSVHVTNAGSPQPHPLLLEGAHLDRIEEGKMLFVSHLLVRGWNYKWVA